MAKLIKGYNGQSYFWNHAYRHSLRDCSVKARRQVYAAFKRNNLELDGLSLWHNTIVLRYTTNCPTRLRKIDGQRGKTIACIKTKTL